MVDPQTLSELHGVLLADILQTAPGAAAESFGDRVVLGFNALAPCAEDAPFSAARGIAGMRFLECSLHVGVARGEALCGILGDARLKRSAAIGPCYRASLVLMELNKHYAPHPKGGRVIIDGSSRSSALSFDYEMSFVDAVRLPRAGQERTLLWHLVRRRPVGAGIEWRCAGDGSEASARNREWLDYLAGGASGGYTDTRILQLLAGGVDGKAYVGADPGFLALCG
eukprot:TRINITY_DN46050_c0_g1_i1.p1 TRINITY_DN46050_c0_g1~~TRINITY_DN46050_c0_g1_i1.p1  ORF type:complete len:240 (+),score=55.18 TRINITY_DN46050_c0_g1_i1:45-722(+)